MPKSIKHEVRFFKSETNPRYYLTHPKTSFKGGETNWFDDTKLIRKSEVAKEV